MHETRRGEMAALQEVPFGRYYGGVDTTPLFVMLAGAYEDRTGDRTLVDRIWHSLLAATAWIERRLAASPTGFLDYARGESTGLVNQALEGQSRFDVPRRWSLSEGAARCRRSAGLRVRGAEMHVGARRHDAATKRQGTAWLSKAEALRSAIEERFWVPAHALLRDRSRRRWRAMPRVRVERRTPALLRRAERRTCCTRRCATLSTRFSSGWGIRTLAEGEPRYNPMSYHNGSIWPHDTSLCAAGISRYGGRANVVQILNDIFETANHFAMRLPELYCGFPRIAGQGPAPYPVACLPQAWSSGSVFLLLQACLGIRVDGERRGGARDTSAAADRRRVARDPRPADRRRNDRPGFPPPRR